VSASKRQLQEELLRRKLRRQAILDSCHDKQRSVLVDPRRYKAILAGRRSGKTMMVSRAIALSLEASGRDDWTFYSAVTRVVAKDLIWPKLEELNTDHQLGWSMRSNDGVITTSRGAMFRVLGFDDSGQVEKSAGYRIRLFCCDEPHSYATKLKYLAEQKIGPALADLGGTLMLSGTPGIARVGYWHDASTGKKSEYGVPWRWTVRDNPLFLRDPDEYIAEELELRGWTVETPAFRREILAEWCEDEGAMVYAFVYERNAVESLEIDYDGLFTLGVDFGVNDACAWAVLYTPPMSRMVYVVHAESHTGMLPDDANEVTAAIVERFKPSRIVGDAGGLGKPYVEAWNRRYGHRAGWHMSAAQKTEKLANIAIVNGELRSERVKVLAPACAPLIDEVTNHVWADERREKEHPNTSNHCLDAAFAYGFRAHTGYLNDTPKPPPKPDEAERLAQQERIRRVQEARRRAQDELEEW
jgi:hypothetical protein